MTWTILALVIAVAIYMFGPMLIKHDSKKAETMPKFVAKEAIKLFAIALMIVGVARIWTPQYLTKTNPGILREMVTGMQAQEKANAGAEIKKYVKNHGDEMMKRAPVLGNKDAKKTIFIFTDYSCPYCRRVDGELRKIMAEDKDVRVVVKNFAIHGALSDAPARAMIAAKMQMDGGCNPEALHNTLMEKNYWPADLKGQSQEKLEKFVKKNVMAAAKNAKCDVKRLEADMNSETVSAELFEVSKLAKQFGINGTPFLIVGDQAFPGAIPAAQIKEALK